MHDSSYQRCKEFIQEHLEGKSTLKIADVGSWDHNGTYRALFDRPGWTYTGFDLGAGPNVDIVVPSGDEDQWPLQNTFDCVISGQVAEHVRKPWKWIKQVASLGKPGAIFWITAPNNWGFHEYPIDCWRIWPDGMRALFDEAGLHEIRSWFVDADTIGIAVK